VSTEKKNILWFTINRLSRLFINFWTGLEVPDVQRAIILLNEPPKWHNQTFRSSVVISPRAFVFDSTNTNTGCVKASFRDTSVILFTSFQGFPSNNLYPYLNSPLCDVRHSPQTLLNFITFKILGEKYKARSFSMYICHQPSTDYTFLSARDKFPYQIERKITVL